MIGPNCELILKRNVTLRKPVDSFLHCPYCDCKDLIPLDEDVMCSRCDWNSIASNAQLQCDYGLMEDPGFLEEKALDQARKIHRDNLHNFDFGDDYACAI